MNANILHRMGLFLLAIAWGTLSVVNCRGGSGNMALISSLTLPKTTILYQEDLAFTLILENRGTSPVKIIPPLMAEAWPVLRLINLGTGKESLHETEKHPQEMAPPPPWTDLSPGQQSALSFLLKKKIPDLLPGEYEVSAIYDYNKGELSTESVPVRLKVIPSTPHNLFLASAIGRASNAYFGSWINLDRGDGHVVWAKIDLMSGGGVKTVSMVEQAGIRSEPILSVPDNGKMAPGQWLAWVDQGQLNFTFFIPGNSSVPPARIPLNNTIAKLVAPIHWKSPGKENPESPRGEVLFLLGRPPEVQFQTLLFNGTTAQSGGGAFVPGGRLPVWIQNIFRSKGDPLAPYILAEPGNVALALLSWGNQKAITSKSLSSWEADFLAGCCVLDDKDFLHGGILVWEGRADETKKLAVILWTLGPDGQFTEKAPREVDWEDSEPIIKADISVNAKDQAAAIVRKDTGEWRFIDPAGKVSPLAGEFLHTDQALTVNFLDMIQPVLIGGTNSLGVKIIGPDGSPIPPLSGY